MIVDCHAHVFQHWDGPCGHASVEIHLKYLQKVVTRPAARTYRARDGKEIRPTMLFRPEDNTWAGLTDVRFRVGPHGQIEQPRHAAVRRQRHGEVQRVAGVLSAVGTLVARASGARVLRIDALRHAELHRHRTGFGGG